ncbi:MAG TPA: glycoside hydrolase family 1 protein [Candidatus Binatia bacterium]|nr:glycoside hydrolase family 1 protein [Candidatus Binatia bacterium]
MSFKGYQFPRGFLWGAATSSHQVEGDNRWNDWWEHEQAGRLPHRSDAACRHYERFEKDFEMARSWGHNAHRFSIEWSRIEPKEGVWDDAALRHYCDVVRALRERGIEPIVTLHHFTNPAWFARRGGWLRRDAAKLFARYATHVCQALGKQVVYWVTINEPIVYVTQGYITGEWPPFLKSAWRQAAIALRNLSRAHVAAYRALHGADAPVKVGFAHNALLVVPCNTDRLRDRIAAKVRDWMWNRLFFRLCGISARAFQRTPGRLDFIGLNYYTRIIVQSSGWGLQSVLGRACRAPHPHGGGPMSVMGWEVYPAGLKIVLEKFSRYGLPLLVTENGIATENESLRREFLQEHLQSLAEALESGVNVIGYLYWSLIDNFEWALGTMPRFGLAAVDYATQQRSPRPCADDFARVCRENRLAPRSSHDFL